MVHMSYLIWKENIEAKINELKADKLKLNKIK